MEQFYTNLSKTLNDEPTDETSLNYDETNLSNNPGDSKCVLKRGVRHPEMNLNSSKRCISIMFTANAALLPTFVVYKSSNLYFVWLEEGPV